MDVPVAKLDFPAYVSASAKVSRAMKKLQWKNLSGSLLGSWYRRTL
jgi:hypothetical protein